MTALANSPEIQYGVKIVSGPQKGKTYKIVSAQLTIGRSSDNDISLPEDKRISRQHAQIKFENHGITVSKISDKGKLLLNGNQVSTGFLQHGSIIQIGNTKIQFLIKGAKSADNSISKQTVQRSFTSVGPAPKKSSATFYIILGAVLLFAGFLFLDNGTKKEALLPQINEDRAELQAEKNRKLIEAYNQQKKLYGKKGEMYRQAQSAYLKGFREYEHGLYHRAIDAFQACLSIEPTHTLCNRYRGLAIRKFNELLQYKMIVGRQYKDQNQYSSCKKTFENIMFMVQDPTSKIYKEAKDNYNVCRTMLKGQY